MLIRIFRPLIFFVLFLTVLGGCTVSSVYTNIPKSEIIETGQAVNVRALGAKGDGKTDDTAAFLAAIVQAQNEDGVVLVPKGQYKISRPLELNEISLIGSGFRAWPADVDVLPSIRPIHRDNPAIILGKGGAIRGIDITYKWEKEPENGPPAVLIKGVGAVVRDVRIRFAWDGISTDGEHNVGRLNIENVLIVSIRNIGVYVAGSWDVPRLNNVEVWNTRNLRYGYLPGVGFMLGKNDLIRMTDCFVHGMNYGFLFEEEFNENKIKGGTWGVMNGCSTDFCTIGLLVHGRHTLSISGGSFWSHDECLLVDGEKARIRMNGSELKSNGAPVVRVKSCDNIVINGCNLFRPMKRNDYPAMILNGGKVVIGSNHIEAHGPGVIVEPGVRSVAITGNVIETIEGQPAIIDHSEAKSVVVIKSNVITTKPKEPVKKIIK